MQPVRWAAGFAGGRQTLPSLSVCQNLRSGLKVVSSIFKGVRVYFNGAFSVRMATLHGLVVSNGGSVTWWKHDAAGRPTHLCTAGLTPAQVNEVM